MITNELEEIINIQLDMERDIRADSYGDIYGHEPWAEEIFHLRKRLKEATTLIEEARDLQITGGYLGQAEGLIYQCERFLRIGKE